MTSSTRLVALLASFAIIGLQGIAAAGPAGTARPQVTDPAAALVVVRGAEPATLDQVASALESRGAHLRHRFPPDLLVGTVPPELGRQLVLPSGATIDIARPAFGEMPASQADPIAVRAALRFLGGEPTRALERGPFPPPMVGDALPELAHAAPKSLDTSGCNRPYATSAFMVGSVAVGIVMPESTDPAEDTEDWDNGDPAHVGVDRRDLVVSGIMAGLDALATGHPDAALRFTYDVHADVPIPYEAIEHPIPERSLWSGAALRAMGFGSASETSSVYAYINDMRDRFDADWGVTAFVADSLIHVPSGWGTSSFPFAYAYLGGPLLVMTYDNDGWGIDRMGDVMAHEISHCFRALDEYTAAGNRCSSTSGWLATKNGNNQSPGPDADCETDVPCEMRGGSATNVCSFTVGQLGMRDTDADTVPDVREAPPNTQLDARNPLLLTTDTAVVAGLVTARGVQAESPHAPASVSVNRVASAEYSLDGGAWAALPADDGAYGGRCERVTIALSGLAEGWHVLEARGTNDLGRSEPSPAQLRIYVNTDCADDASEPDDDEATGVARHVATYAGLHHCAFDPDWSQVQLQRDANLTATITYDPAAALTLQLLSPSLVPLATAMPLAPGTTTLSATAPADGTYFLVVNGPLEAESDYTLQLVADCIDDPSEPNGTVADATAVEPGLLRERVLCAGDADHYRIAVQAGETVSATATFQGAFGDLDLELFDPSRASVAVSNGTGDVETVSITPTVEGVYTIRVVGKTPADGNVYDLLVGATGCIDDVGENDDTAVEARPLVTPAAVRGVTCSGDEDWFSFSVSATSLARLGLAYDATAGNLDLELRDASGANVIARSASLGSFEDITVDRLRPGTYTARVFSPTGDGGDYALTVQVEDPILLFVHKDPHDAILSWNDAHQECYTYRRSTTPGDFSSAVTVVVQDGDEIVQDLTYRDVGVIHDGAFLYCYLIDPHDCGASLLGSTKTADPYPVLPPHPGGLPTVTYTVTATNGGDTDAIGVTVRDDVPFAGSSFIVLEIPPGATDNSLTAPAGRYGRGQVVIDGVNVPAGGSAVVRFSVTANPNLSNESATIDNQARLEVPPIAPYPARVFLTDDAVTRAFEDDTRVYVSGPKRYLQVGAFWHKQVDVDLRVIDPCGNVISPQDMPSAACGGVMGWDQASSCSAPGFPGRFESVRWFTWPSAPGTYQVELAYAHSAADDGTCRDRGTEDVTLVVESPMGLIDVRSVTLEPGPGFAPVLQFTLP